MNFHKIFLPIAGALLVAAGWRMAGWGGVALAAGAIVMYLLLHFNRMMAVLKRAANNPKGYVGSAVMLNSKLKPGVNLMHVMALTNSLGELLSAPDEQPEVFRWSDGTASSVTCEFVDGRLAKWALDRPQGTDPVPPPAAP